MLFRLVHLKISTLRIMSYLIPSIILGALILLVACQPDKPSEETYEYSENNIPASIDVNQSSLILIKERGVLRVGTAITDPFEYYDPKSGELIGFDVDLMKRIAEDLNVKIEWTEMSFAGLLPSVQDRNVDAAIAAIYIKKEREEVVDFSEPYIQTGLVMAVRPELVSSVKSIDDLSGLKVGVKIGATGAELAQDLVVRGIDIEIVEYKDTLSSLLDLEVGRLEVVFNDYLNTKKYISDANSDLQIVLDENNEINFLSNVGLGIAVHKGEYELLSIINRTLDCMRQNGELKYLEEKWINPKAME
jgi:ABC-type amino acid transport substrate-binding protein